MCIRDRLARTEQKEREVTSVGAHADLQPTGRAVEGGPKIKVHAKHPVGDRHCEISHQVGNVTSFDLGIRKSELKVVATVRRLTRFHQMPAVNERGLRLQITKRDMQQR